MRPDGIRDDERVARTRIAEHDRERTVELAREHVDSHVQPARDESRLRARRIAVPVEPGAGREPPASRRGIDGDSPAAEVPTRKTGRAEAGALRDGKRLLPLQLLREREACNESLEALVGGSGRRQDCEEIGHEPSGNDRGLGTRDRAASSLSMQPSGIAGALGPSPWDTSAWGAPVLCVLQTRGKLVFSMP